MTSAEDERIKKYNGLCSFLGTNITAFTGDVAFEAIATNTVAYYAHTVNAATAAAAANTGYYLKMVNIRKVASIIISELCYPFFGFILIK